MSETKIATPKAAKDAPPLLPCPFCGESEAFRLECEQLATGLVCNIRCGNCAAASGSAEFGPHAAYWNNRTPQEPATEMVERAAEIIWNAVSEFGGLPWKEAVAMTGLSGDLIPAGVAAAREAARDVLALAATP